MGGKEERERLWRMHALRRRVLLSTTGKLFQPFVVVGVYFVLFFFYGAGGTGVGGGGRLPATIEKT